MPALIAPPLACPFCRCSAPDMVEVWRGRGFCSSCGRIFPLQPAEAPASDTGPNGPRLGPNGPTQAPA